MPNHVTNVLTLHGESDQIRAMLEAIQYDDLGIGSVDFNKIIPMLESLNIEASSQPSTGLKAYTPMRNSMPRRATALIRHPTNLRSPRTDRSSRQR